MVYSPEDIIKYLSKKLNCLNFKMPSVDFINSMFDIQYPKIPKITFEQDDKEKSENGCF